MHSLCAASSRQEVTDSFSLLISWLSCPFSSSERIRNGERKRKCWSWKQITWGRKCFLFSSIFYLLLAFMLINASSDEDQEERLNTMGEKLEISSTSEGLKVKGSNRETMTTPFRRNFFCLFQGEERLQRDDLLHTHDQRKNFGAHDERQKMITCNMHDIAFHSDSFPMGYTEPGERPVRICEEWGPAWAISMEKGSLV